MKSIRYGTCLALLWLCAWLTTAWSQDSNVATPTASVSAAPVSPAQVPRLVRYSGTLLDASGKPQSGVVGVSFLFYKEQSGGAPLWMEMQNVTVDAKGHYSVLLGSSKPDGLPTDLFAGGEARWLAVQPEREAEQARVLLLSVPYALKAMDAETLGGKPISAFQLAVPQGQNGSSTLGGKPISAFQLAVPQGQNGSSTPKLAPAAEQPNEIICASGTACQSTFVPLFTSNGGSAKVGDSIVTQSGIGATAKIGLGTTSPGARLDVLGSDSSAPAAGVQVSTKTFPQYLFNASGGAANAKIWRMIGRGTNDFEIQTLNDSYSGEVTAMQINRSGTSITSVDFPNGNVGIGTVHPGASLHAVSNTTQSAVLGVNNVDNGTGAVTGQNFGTATFASGVLGAAISTSGLTYGVNGLNNSTEFRAAGVEGDELAASGKTFGTIGTVASPNGTALWGVGQAQSQIGQHVGCCGPVGVWGDTSSNASGAAGLVGTADDGFALVVENNSTTHLTASIQNDTTTLNTAILTVNAPGTHQFCNINTSGILFCSGSHSLVVPVDNSQRQVALYAVESPQNWFEDFGSGHLESGVGTIALEPTFAQTVNTGSDYHVFLTPKGECRGLYVSNESATGFEVHELGGGRSNVAFDYRVVALRRGYENVRLEDQTEMVAKTKDSAGLPLAEPFTASALPVVVPTKSASVSPSH